MPNQASQTPSPAAMRAAEAIRTRQIVNAERKKGVSVAELAAIIDRETGCAELREVLSEMLADAETMREPYRNEAICERAQALLEKE